MKLIPGPTVNAESLRDNGTVCFVDAAPDVAISIPALHLVDKDELRRTGHAEANIHEGDAVHVLGHPIGTIVEMDPDETGANLMLRVKLDPGCNLGWLTVGKIMANDLVCRQ